MTGADLKRRRIALGLTQEDLARLWNVTQAAVSNWENEKYGIRHPEILNQALKHLESKPPKNGSLGTER